MNRVFADAYFYIALLNTNDPAHARATEYGGRGDLSFATTEFVLLEVADALCAPRYRQLAARLPVRLRASSATHIVPVGKELLERGRTLYAARPDKEWSLTDCVSFVVMGDAGISDALTADRHFQQAGFRALMAGD